MATSPPVGRAEPRSRRVIRTARLAYRAHIADRLDSLLAISDPADFAQAWSAVSPTLGWCHRPSARRLWQLAGLPWSGTIVEIGSYLANSTVYLALAGGKVHAVDPHTPSSMSQVNPNPRASSVAGSQAASLGGDVSAAFLRNLQTFDVGDRVIYHRTTSVQAAAAWAAEPVRLLYVDGLHTYDAVKQDYFAWKPFLADEHVVLFDDYLWAEVQQAVDELRSLSAPSFFYVRGGQAMFSTSPLPLRVVGLP